MAYLIGKIIVDSDGNITKLGKSVASHLSLLEGQMLHQAVHLADQINLLSFLADLRAHHMVHRLRVKIQAANSLHFIDVSISHNKNFDEQNKFLLKLESEAALTEDETISEAYSCENISSKLTHNVSIFAKTAHELCTPLNAIIGFADLMVSTENLSSKSVRDYATTIKKAGHHLLAIVHDILENSANQAELEIAKPDFGDIEFCDARDTILTAIAFARPVDGSRQINVELDLTRGIKLACDALSVRQIIINLISNALKYSLPPSEIKVSAYRLTKNRLRCVVTDEGNGINPVILEKIGTPFLRAKECNSKEGHGLGLYLVQSLAQKIGAAIKFETLQGVGTKVFVDLPVTKIKQSGSEAIVNLKKARDINYIDLKRESSLGLYGKEGKEKTKKQKTA